MGPSGFKLEVWGLAWKLMGVFRHALIYFQPRSQEAHLSWRGQFPKYASHSHSSNFRGQAPQSAIFTCFGIHILSYFELEAEPPIAAFNSAP